MNEYIYSVARVRAKETSLLTGQDMEQLLNSDSFESALLMLHDRAKQGERDISGICADAERELWTFLEELAGADVLKTLRIPIDYHNIKASVKAVFSDTDASDLLLGGGTADAETIYESVKQREYGELEPSLAAVCSEATSILLRTQDGQLCDIYIDRAMLRAEEDAAKESGEDFMVRCARLHADTANLGAAYRCALSQRSLSFIENALYDGGSLSADALAKAASGGMDSLYRYVGSTSYDSGAAAMRSGAAAFEKWCADEMIKLAKEAQFETLSCAPIIAYYYLKSAEINTVRLILSGKLNHLDKDIIRERVPEIYV